ncbi:MAG: RNHCP domain-containing protein [Candidatus Pacebacteria bacterium]|nr:RNHCP domain-containing protein [Candidatus Paceibacterota bacterium]
MMTTTFQRTREDFTCEHCGTFVQGNGYTNHCPQCLWSKHVDVHPGDRLSPCAGLMRPIGLEVKRDTYDILHRCERCGFERRNKTTEKDDFDTIATLSKQLAEQRLP